VWAYGQKPAPSFPWITFTYSYIGSEGKTFGLCVEIGLIGSVGKTGSVGKPGKSRLTFASLNRGSVEKTVMFWKGFIWTVPFAIAGAAIATNIIAMSAATARTKTKRFMRNLLFLWVVGCTTGSVRLAKVPI
jgi:hypothetical protein